MCNRQLLQRELQHGGAFVMTLGAEPASELLRLAQSSGRKAELLRGGAGRLLWVEARTCDASSKPC